jgi:putative ABC transport system substrate-binding protein
MRRREFIIGGAAAAWPVGARAQQQLPKIGFLSAGSLNGRAHLVNAFREGLSRQGFVEKTSVAIEYRFADSQPDRLRAMANELVALKLNAIAAPGGIPAPMVLKDITTSIPIVFSVGEDPVKLGPCQQPQPTRRQHHWRQLLYLHRASNYSTAGGSCSYRSDVRQLPCWKRL